MSPRRRRLRPSVLERDLTHLADGTLEPGRRGPLERLVTESPELQRRLDDQRRAVEAARFVAQRERAPLALRIHRRALGAKSRPRRPKLLVGGLAGSVAAVAAVLALAAGGEPGLTVAQAATLATRPPLASVGEPAGDADTLPRLRAAGLPFPYWEDEFGWRATGVRTDRIDGRDTTTVFYRHGRQEIAYTIVSGSPLSQQASATDLGGRRVITWLRHGHSCVLSGRDVPTAALVQLAAWSAD